jgi:3-dehydroquinate synthetase
MYTIDMMLSKGYQIIIKNNLLNDIDSEIKKVYQNKNVYIITDERVGAIYLQKVEEALSSFSV